MWSVHMRSVGERSSGGGGAVTIKGGIQGVPFDPPAHHLEETPEMNGINWFDQTYGCFKRPDCGRTDSEGPPRWISQY